jgi:hypothetical protein
VAWTEYFIHKKGVIQMPDIYKNRLARLRDKMKQNNIDGALVTERVNYMYMSGFTGTSAILFIDQNRAALLTDFRYVEQAASQSPDYEIIQYRGGQFDEINRLIEEDGVRNLSFEDSRMTYAEYSEYREKLKANEFLPLGRVLEELRIIKDESEILNAVAEGLKYDREVMIEKYIKGDEITCCILKGKMLPVLAIKPRSSFFDYTSKYADGGADEFIVELEESLHKKVEYMALKCCELLKCSVYSRVDLIVQDENPMCLK